MGLRSRGSALLLQRAFHGMRLVSDFIPAQLLLDSRQDSFRLLRINKFAGQPLRYGLGLSCGFTGLRTDLHRLLSLDAAAGDNLTLPATKKALCQSPVKRQSKETTETQTEVQL